MGRIIEKRLRLRRRSSNDIIYPKTLASLVMTRDGKTVEEAMAGIAESIPEGYSLVGAVASGDSTELDFVDKGAYVLGVGTYTIGESSEEVEEGYIGIALMATMANDTNTVSLIQIAVGAGGSGGSTGGGGLYTLPIVVNLDQGKYSMTGEIDMAALRSCSKVSMGFTSAELPEGVVYEIEWGFNCRTRQYYEGYVDQEVFLFGQYEVNGTMKDLNLEFSNGQLTMLKTGDTSFTNADGGGSDPAVI